MTKYELKGLASALVDYMVSNDIVEDINVGEVNQGFARSTELSKFCEEYEVEIEKGKGPYKAKKKFDWGIDSLTRLDSLDHLAEQTTEPSPGVDTVETTADYVWHNAAEPEPVDPQPVEPTNETLTRSQTGLSFNHYEYEGSVASRRIEPEPELGLFSASRHDAEMPPIISTGTGLRQQVEAANLDLLRAQEELAYHHLYPRSMQELFNPSLNNELSDSNV